MNKLISPEQSGFISVRYIGDNTRLIYDLMYCCENSDITGLLMLVDFQKAYDSISWKFLYSVMKLYGFGPSILRWINTFNNNIKATVLQSGVMLSFLNIEKGCHQGDPLAAYLFLMCAQILLLMTKHDKSIKGISIGQTEYKLTQFADDTTIILDGSKASLLAALNTLEIYGSLSGLKVNTDKTKLIWIGKKRYSRDRFETVKDLRWGCTEFELLGLSFSVDLSEMVKANYNKIMMQFEKELKTGR